VYWPTKAAGLLEVRQVVVGNVDEFELAVVALTGDLGAVEAVQPPVMPS
jgi:hypothetical protein